MKLIKFLSLLIIAVISFTSCDQEDDLVFVAKVPEEGISFSNVFLEEYTLTAAASKNIGERFTWEDAYFGVPTNVEYELQHSIIGDFTDVETVSSTDGNELSITIGDMLKFAANAGLDNDPNSENPNTGNLYFRLMASPGTDGGLPVFTETQTLSVVLPEAVESGAGFEVASWGVVGSGYNNWGAFADAKFYTTATEGVIVSYVNLIDGDIKFRENNEWGGDLGDANGDGILDADPENNIAVTAGDYKITIDTNDNSYTIEEFSWGIVGSGYNDWGNGGPDAKLYYDYTTDTFKASVMFVDGDIKFRMNNAWGGDLGDANGDGILDADPENNIAVTAGHYFVTVDLKDKSYSIEEATVWGAVGSGYNNWGETPDAALTEIQPGIWYAENVNLIDGDIKFRPNNEWNGDYGDANEDNILDQDPENNIAVTAGNYVISIDFNDVDGPRYYLGKR
ncbi:SusE domain-containing protein [Aestuariibaculum sediminum]|uniref:SusE domain-containing protein n=1 Tax=Aestuariibaculum sediminum TaxID=2770637 RepID=A0A8J6UHV1_9FLAO|nr:SusE domain-containing protein [Aestuariibaculum sediminum]MBD0833416.1 SusE domain-containing protein [Aestuariibaculum sediminum]